MNLLLAIAFSIVYILGYIYFLFYHFEYAGFDLVEKLDYLRIGVSVIMASFPIIFFDRVKALSSFISIFIFLILYMPIILTFAISVEGKNFEIFEIQWPFVIGMVLFFLSDTFLVKAKNTYVLKVDLFKMVFYLTILSTLYMLLIYRNNLKLASFEDVYIQRFANADIGTDIFTRYISSWLANFMIPVCLAYGLIGKKHIYTIIGTASCIVIYMATAAKSVVLFPFIFVGFYILFSRNRIYEVYRILGITLLVIMIITLFFGFNVFSSLFWMRTVGNGGYMTVHYYNFFSTHPNTFYTHINIIKAITGAYPYGIYDIGQVVGKYYWTEDMSANANFWASDGIAAMGLIGVLFISVVFFITLRLINFITYKYNKLFLVLAFIPFLSSLLNMPLFSSLWTGGAIWMLVFLSLVNTRINPEVLTNNNTGTN